MPVYGRTHAPPTASVEAVGMVNRQGDVLFWWWRKRAGGWVIEWTRPA